MLTCFTAFRSRDELFDKTRDNSNLAGGYSSFISQQLCLYSGSKGCRHLGALIIEPGKTSVELLYLSSDPAFDHVLFQFLYS